MWIWIPYPEEIMERIDVVNGIVHCIELEMLNTDLECYGRGVGVGNK